MHPNKTLFGFTLLLFGLHRVYLNISYTWLQKK